MDYDDIQSDQEPEVGNNNNLLDDDDDLPLDRSPSPSLNDSDSKSKPRKRLIKKGSTTAKETTPNLGDNYDDDEEAAAAFVRDESDGGYDSGKRKKFSREDGGSGSRKKKLKLDRREKGGSSSKFKVKKSSGERSRDHEGDDVKEMWDTIAGGDSEVWFLLFYSILRISL